MQRIGRMAYVKPIVILALFIEHQTFDSVGKLLKNASKKKKNQKDDPSRLIPLSIHCYVDKRNGKEGMRDEDFLSGACCSPDAGVSPDSKDDGEPRGDGVKDDREMGVEEREDGPRESKLCMRRIVVLDRSMDREGNVLYHDHEISDCKSCKDGICGAEHFLPVGE